MTEQIVVLLDVAFGVALVWRCARQEPDPVVRAPRGLPTAKVVRCRGK